MPRWTPEARKKHAERIRDWNPWTRSTGPRTESGKIRSSRNAWKGGDLKILGNCGEVLRLMALYTAQVRERCRVNSSFRRNRARPLGAAFSSLRTASRPPNDSHRKDFMAFCRFRDFFPARYSP